MTINFPKIDYKSVPKANDASKRSKNKAFVSSPVKKTENTPKITAFMGKDLVSEIHPVAFIDKYIDYDVIEKAIKHNPIIPVILAECNLKPVINEANIDLELKKHLFTTYVYSRDIAETVGLNNASKKILYQAALIHDIGKALIPEKILKKPRKLTPKEKRIMDLHAELGYEIVKCLDLDKGVADVIFLHHLPYNDSLDDILPSILSVADIYSALTEDRIYRPAYSNKEAFEIMDDNHNLDQRCVRILKNTYGDIQDRFTYFRG